MPKKTNTKINGSNYFRVTATIGKNANGSPMRKQFYGSSKKEAEAKRDEYMLSINKGLSPNFDKALFKYVFKAWFDNVLTPSISLSSRNRYEMDYRLRIKDCLLSEMKLVDIKSIHMQAYYNDLLKAYTVNTVRLTHKLLRSFFIYCIKTDLIIKSPMIAVELPKDKPVSDTNKPISDDDIKRLLHAANENIENFIFVFAIFSGLRLGEILSLTHGDLDFVNNTIHVNKSVKYLNVDGKWQAVLSHTKTLSSIREVPILNAIQRLLQAHIKHEKEKHLKLGVPFTSESILFSSYSGTYREASNVRKMLIRLCDRVGIERTTFHSLRHTFCTILAKQDVPLKTASVLMGHGDIGITAKIYTHVDSYELKRGIEKLSVYFE